MTDTRVDPPVASSADEVARAPRSEVHRIDGREPRYLALRNFAISISAFNILGYTVLGFEQPWAWPILAVLTGYSAEIGFELVSAWAQGRRPGFTGHGAWGVYTFLLPTHITALAVNMLLYTNDRFAAVAFGVVVAIGSKFLLRAPINGRMRHFMNPSNFGITVTLLAFSSWVSIAPPYEFTENIPDLFRVLVPLVIIVAGTVLNAMLTRKIPLIVGWTGGFVIQALLRHYIWDAPLWTGLSVMIGVAFVLFTNYMITDPGTTPFGGRDQFLFGASVAAVYGVLMLFNVVYTLFFAVTIVCLARGLYWWGRTVAQRLVHPIPRGRPVLAELNSGYHRLALNGFMVIVLAHWAEHLAQAYQIWVLGMPRAKALGALGMVFPWLVTSEWLHYGYALVMLVGLALLRRGFFGRARTWWTLALAIQFWHHIEHLLLLAQAQSGHYLFGRTVPTSIVQLVAPRVELHLFYNSIVFVPMVVAVYLHLRPNANEASRMSCACAARQAVAASTS